MATKTWAWASVAGTSAFMAFTGYAVFSAYQLHQQVDSAGDILATKPAYAVTKESTTQEDMVTTRATPKKQSLVSAFTDFKKVSAGIGDTKTTILLLGVDARTNELKGRSDAMVLLTLDKENDSMKMVSIPRDSYVELVGRGTHDKITHAFAYGGLDMAKATVEKMLDVEIDHHLVVNFTSFKSIIDSLGGIEVDSPLVFTEQNAKGVANALRFERGVQTLNGEQALAYARMRKQDPKGDIGRGERQKQVISATMKKLKELDSLKSYGDIFTALRKGVNTDVGLKDIAYLTGYVDAFKHVDSYHIKGSDMKLNGVYYYKLSEESLSEVKKAFD